MSSGRGCFRGIAGGAYAVAARKLFASSVTRLAGDDVFRASICSLQQTIDDNTTDRAGADQSHPYSAHIDPPWQ
jgi:hypothetical protein